MKKKQPSSILGSCFLPFIAGVVLLLALLVIALKGVPARAEQIYGPARAEVNPIQRYFIAITLVLKKDTLVHPIDPLGQPIEFEVQVGESTPSIIGRLYAQGFITDPGAFRSYLVYAGLDTSLQAGLYQLSTAMTAIEIAAAMQETIPTEAELFVFPGWRLEEIANALPSSGLEVTAKAFISTAQLGSLKHAVQTYIPPGASYEGFLSPGEYTLSRDLTAPELVTIFLDRFQEKLSQEIQGGFDQQGLSVYEAVTLASIVQREAVVTDEMPLIASVFLNRLKAGSRLAADPTVQYALGYNEAQQKWWTNPLGAADLQYDSLYNTYVYTGLPPGPICSPGVEALRAVAFPAQTPYYYFRALCDGSGRHAFAETYEEHLNNACSTTP
jgi:UPF0755 protein